MKLKDACSLEEKLTKLDSTFKSRAITLLTKIRIIKSMIFPVIIYRCESWTVKKVELQELILLNCGAREDSSESLGQHGYQTSQS